MSRNEITAMVLKQHRETPGEFGKLWAILTFDDFAFSEGGYLPRLYREKIIDRLQEIGGFGMENLREVEAAFLRGVELGNANAEVNDESDPKTSKPPMGAQMEEYSRQ